MGNVARALHTRTYMIGKNSNKNASAKGAAAYRSASIVAAAAYRSNDKIKNEIDGKIHDYSRKQGVVFSKIFLPVNAPKNFADRSTLWNEVERVENRKNSQFARQWEASFPPGFSEATRESLLTEFVKDFFVSQGMIADVAIHDVADRHGGRNIHTHVLLTLRRVDEQGFTGNKERLWNDKKLAQLWRTGWADRCNEIYKKMDLPTRIDPRSYEIQNNGLEPTEPIGKYANQLEKRGIATESGNKNRQIMVRNQQRQQAQIYDLMVEQPVDQPDEQRGEVSEVEYQEWREQLKDARWDRDRTFATMNDLSEIQENLEKMEQMILLYDEAGDERSKAQVERSLHQIRQYLMSEYKVTPVTMGDLLEHVTDEHNEAFNKAKKLEAMEKDFNVKINQPEPEEEKAPEIEQDRDQDREQERIREREREHER